MIYRLKISWGVSIFRDMSMKYTANLKPANEIIILFRLRRIVVVYRWE